MNFTRPLTAACGGGTNSFAYLIGFKRRGIRPDLITFSDTKGEKPNTYKSIEILSDWCVSVGFPDITIVRTVSPTHGFEGLEGMTLRNGTLPSKAFGLKACSQRYKIEAQHKFLNSWKPAREVWAICEHCDKPRSEHQKQKVTLSDADAEKRKAKTKTVYYCTSHDHLGDQFKGKRITSVIGYDAGEPQRAKSFENEHRELFWYPLIEWGWGRDECIQAIKEEGLPLPGKSACFFCPSMRKPEVIALSKEHPELFERAVTMERNARSSGKLGVVKGLGRHWSWEELVAASEDQRSLFPENRMGIDCACFDGEPEEE